MFRCFFPDEYLDSAYVIDYDRLYREGYRGLIYDIDNTLVPHGAPADERAIALFAHLRELGFGYCLLSNNQIERVSSFADAIGAQFIENAHKPSPLVYPVLHVLLPDRSAAGNGFSSRLVQRSDDSISSAPNIRKAY